LYLRIISRDEIFCKDIALVISGMYQGFLDPRFTHDWKLTRKHRSELAKHIAYCLYGELGSKLVDLHAVLDRTEQRRTKTYDELFQWIRQNNIDKDVALFIKTLWKELSKDLLGGRRGSRYI